MLSEAEMTRYRRQIGLAEIGTAGQEKLKAARVLVVGAGGLGSPVALYLAAAGVGHLGLADADEVELTNLNRQILHFTPDIGRRKVDSAREKLAALNPAITVETLDLRLTEENVGDTVAGYGVVVGCVDNLPTRYLVNRTCAESGKAYVEGGVNGFTGMVMTVLPGQGPCYECLFPAAAGKAHQAKAEPGVIGAAAGLVGTLQAIEIIKVILGIGQPLSGRLLVIDTLRGSFSEVKVKRDPGCPVCGSL